jgi:hypothetical protein
VNAYKEIQKPERQAEPRSETQLLPFATLLRGTQQIRENIGVPSGYFTMLAAPSSAIFPAQPGRFGFPESPGERQPALVIQENFERKLAEFELKTRQLTLDRVRQHYVMPADPSVRGFLFTHPDISPILLDAIPPLNECFGTETVFKLKAPLDTDGMRTLYAVVLWSGKLIDARNALAKFDEWWIPRSEEAGGYLVFTYELI